MNKELGNQIQEIEMAMLMGQNFGSYMVVSPNTANRLAELKEKYPEAYKIVEDRETKKQEAYRKERAEETAIFEKCLNDTFGKWFGLNNKGTDITTT